MKYSALSLVLFFVSACAHGGSPPAQSSLDITTRTPATRTADDDHTRIEVSHRYVLSGSKDAELIVVSADPEQPPVATDNSK